MRFIARSRDLAAYIIFTYRSRFVNNFVDIDIYILPVEDQHCIDKYGMKY